MAEAPENGKESSHSAHGNGMNVCYVTNLTYDGSDRIYIIAQSNTTFH